MRVLLAVGILLLSGCAIREAREHESEMWKAAEEAAVAAAVLAAHQESAETTASFVARFQDELEQKIAAGDEAGAELARRDMANLRSTLIDILKKSPDVRRVKEIAEATLKAKADKQLVLERKATRQAGVLADTAGTAASLATGVTPTGGWTQWILGALGVGSVAGGGLMTWRESLKKPITPLSDELRARLAERRTA